MSDHHLPKQASSDQLIDDLSTGGQIFLDIHGALCSTDPNAAMKKVIDKGEYDFHPDNVMKSMKKKHNGKGFDIRLFGGKYYFTKPEDLDKKVLTINPTNKMMGIDGKIVKFVIAKDDHVTFTYQKKEYDIQFDVGYKPEDQPQDHMISGHRGTKKEKETETVEAYQNVPDPKKPVKPDDPLPDKENPDPSSSLNTGMLGALLGLGALYMGYMAYKQIKEKLQDKDTQRARDAREVTQNIIEMADMSTGGWVPDPDLGPHRDEIDRVIQREVTNYCKDHKIDPDKLTTDDVHKIYKKASKAAMDKLEDVTEDVVKGASNSRFGSMPAFTDAPPAYESTILEIGSKASSALYDKRKAGLGHDKPYLQHTVKSAVQIEIAKKAELDAHNYRNAAKTARDQKQTDIGLEKQKNRALHDRKTDLKNEGYNEQQIENDPQVIQLEQDITDLETDEKNQDTNATQDDNDAGDEDTKKDDADKENKKEHGEADKHVQDIFG